MSSSDEHVPGSGGGEPSGDRSGHRSGDRPAADAQRRASLLAAHANRALDARAGAELRALVVHDEQAAGEVAAFRELHALLDEERDLLQVTVLPSEPWEQIDPLWQRLAAAADAAEQELRHRLHGADGTSAAADSALSDAPLQMPLPTAEAMPSSHRTSIDRTSAGRTPADRSPADRTREERTRGARGGSAGRKQGDNAEKEGLGEPAVRPSAFSGRRLAAFVLAAAAIVLVAFWLGRGSRAPDLVPSRPDRSTLGNFVMIAPRLGPESRTLSWQAVVGARAYDVSVQDGAGNVILQRDGAQAQSTEWTITSEQFRALEQRLDPLSVRVVARDGAGVPIGSSGDQPLSLVK